MREYLLKEDPITIIIIIIVMCSFMCSFSQSERTAHYKKNKITVQAYRVIKKIAQCIIKLSVTVLKPGRDKVSCGTDKC